MAPTHKAPKPPMSALKNSFSSLRPNVIKPSTSSSLLFPSTKRDKRHIKHAALLSKITKPASKTPRRRRPDKKLVATLNSLANALPDDEESPEQRAPSGSTAAAKDQVNIIRRKSMKSRPGAMKRREKLDQGERERFAKNLAQMAVSTTPSDNTQADMSEGTTSTGATSQRWAALRGFIAETLEQKPEFKTNFKS